MDIRTIHSSVRVALLVALAACGARSAAAAAFEPLELAPVFGYPGSGSSFEPWRPSRPHAFLMGGISILGTDGPLGTGWTLSGGGEFPVADGTWTLVPRASVSGADAGGFGSLFLGRATLDGRLTRQRGGILFHTEAGAGVGLVDDPAERPAPDPDSPPGYAQRTKGTFVFQIVEGARSDPEFGPSFVLEFHVVLAPGADATSALEVLAGIGF